jgi:hypothetical protein
MRDRSISLIVDVVVGKMRARERTRGMMTRTTTLTCIVILIAAAFANIGAQDTDSIVTNPNLVRNSSFENPKRTWIDTRCNYMALAAGSTAIPQWTVSTSTVNEIVWAMTPTCDAHTAAGGTFFLDLTGFGGDSPNGTVQQRLQKLIVGHTYNFSMYVITDSRPPLVTVDGVPVTLTAGKPIKKGSDIWTPQNGTFTAESVNPVLMIQNQAIQIEFVDRVVVRAQ